ncbi:MAG: hypothetical protein G01um101419_110 [Parcubacteria group bacterium Gr01-1014_19]|nr:MAG: hypothetical protein G01um101419_110 [Parcubacteria group bacterium Gr01-1014_19]
MEKYPDGRTYYALYQRFADHRVPKDLIRRAGPLDGKLALDLCGGSGRLALMAVEEGARMAWLVEQEEAMIFSEAWLDPKIRVAVSDVESALFDLQKFGAEFQAVFCQQAVNYWLNERTVDLLANVMPKDGVFIFNTFIARPPEKPVVKEYGLDGHSFVEVSWAVGDVVHHVQVRDGLSSHTTTFKWLSQKSFRAILEKRFSVEVQCEDKTAIYCCVKK